MSDDIEFIPLSWFFNGVTLHNNDTIQPTNSVSNQTYHNFINSDSNMQLVNHESNNTHDYAPDQFDEEETQDPDINNLTILPNGDTVVGQIFPTQTIIQLPHTQSPYTQPLYTQSQPETNYNTNDVQSYIHNVRYLRTDINMPQNIIPPLANRQLFVEDHSDSNIIMILDNGVDDY